MIIKIHQLCKSFGETPAVKDLSFTISSGDITGFVGPNGAGKTTTLRILATLDEPSSGQIYIDSSSILSRPEIARELIGFVPDSLPLQNDMTVHEYLDFFARAYGIKANRREKLVRDLEDFTNLTGIREKLLDALSKGMKQRVSIARALIHDPKFLLMDEPAAGLDPRARIELRELLKVLASQGKGILISSHILSELSEICNSALIIEQGELLRFGNIEEITSEQHSPTRRLLIRPIDEMDGLCKYLLLQPEVINPVVAGKNVEIEFEGSDEEAFAFLQRLLQQNFKIVEFRFRQQNLESIFMNITKGEVQ